MFCAYGHQEQTQGNVKCIIHHHIQTKNKFKGMWNVLSTTKYKPKGTCNVLFSALLVLSYLFIYYSYEDWHTITNQGITWKKNALHIIFCASKKWKQKYNTSSYVNI